MMQEGEAASSVAKAGAVWTGVAVGHTAFSFADLASILAAVYSTLLIVEWYWRKFKAWKRKAPTQES